MSATILKQLSQLSEPQLFRLSEAIDAEMEHRAKNRRGRSRLCPPAHRRAPAELPATRGEIGAIREGFRFGEVGRSAACGLSRQAPRGHHSL